MSALSDRIAAEHVLYRCTENGGPGVYGQPVEVYVGYQCECGWTTKDSAATSQHLTEVTERAVRDTIAQQLDNLEHDREAINHSARHGFGTEWVEGHDHAIRVATALTREGTTP